MEFGNNNNYTVVNNNVTYISNVQCASRFISGFAEIYSRSAVGKSISFYPTKGSIKLLLN